MLILTLQGQSQGLWLWENTRLLPSTISVKIHNLWIKITCETRFTNASLFALRNRLNTTTISRVCYVRVACIGCIFSFFVAMMARSIHSLYIILNIVVVCNSPLSSLLHKYVFTTWKKCSMLLGWRTMEKMIGQGSALSQACDRGTNC